MRIYEILLEDYNEGMRDEVIGQLVSIKANKGDSIPTRLLVKNLNDMGFSCTVDSIASLLTGIDIVASVDSDVIKLGDKTEGSQEDGMSKEQSDDAVMDRLTQQGINR